MLENECFFCHSVGIFCAWSFLRNDKSFLRNDKSFLRNDKSFLRNDKSFLRNDKRKLLLNYFSDDFPSVFQFKL
ncbi:MAG: hypothetical protein RLZZ628_3941 [Bacteroidota bacterium]|jgi:hypothetical protein